MSLRISIVFLENYFILKWLRALSWHIVKGCKL